MPKRPKPDDERARHAPAEPFDTLHKLNLEAGQIRPGEFPTERFVAFIDILGFRDLIERMFSDEPTLFKTVLDALEHSKWMAEAPDPENVRAVTAFSDSVVISEGGRFGMAGLIATVRAFAGELLKRGILCRGGIARGRTYHANGIVFGEGIVRAYDLERDVARTARIVIAHDVAPSIHFLIEDPIPLLKRDADGRLILNVFNYFWKRADISSENAVSGDHWGGAVDEPGLLQARSGLMDALSRAQSKSVEKPRILEKVIWAVKQFNETLQQVQGLQIPPITVK